MPGLHYRMTDGDLSLQVQSSQQSLMTAVNKFVHAVDQMQETVMIPNKLKDIEVGAFSVPVPVLDVHSTKTTNGHLKDSALLAVKARNGVTSSPTPATNGHAAPSSGVDTHEPDLYNFYMMLGAIRAELARGPGTPDDDAEADAASTNYDEQSRHTAAMFRHHLRGLFGVLGHLTDTANSLTSRYQEELGVGIGPDASIAASISSSSFSSLT